MSKKPEKEGGNIKKTALLGSPENYIALKFV
jgi:hypothetical protein